MQNTIRGMLYSIHTVDLAYSAENLHELPNLFFNFHLVVHSSSFYVLNFLNTPPLSTQFACHTRMRWRGEGTFGSMLQVVYITNL